MTYKLLSLILTFFINTILSIPLEDPSKWPGHLEPFGSKQNIVQIKDVSYEWPLPADFFNSYVNKVKPVLIKGVFKYSKPVKLWTDNYLMQHPKSRESKIMVEPNLKENRTSTQKPTSFFDFLNMYHKMSVLTFSGMPKHLRKDISLPEPLRCNSSQKYLVNANLVMSQGGSRSHVYNDDVESIYCSLRGKTDYLLMEYNSNKANIVDRPQGGYSTVDVDRVDFVKYPNLRKIKEFIKVELNPGDCLYVPYRWYKQFNGFANEEGQSIALNIWFQHSHGHRPVCQPTGDTLSTLDQYKFSDDEDHEGVDEDGNENEEPQENIPNRSLLLHFTKYVKIKDNLTINYFYHIIKRDKLINHDGATNLKFPKSFQILIEELFRRLDVDSDKKLSKHDFDVLKKNKDGKFSKIDEYLEYQTARIEDYIEDLFESKHHDETIHEFDKRKMAEIKATRPFDEL